MAVTIKEVKKESSPATRFIGKRYENAPVWDEWWQNDWFSVLEETEWTYIGAVHIVNGMPEYWVGMFFPADTKVLNGFE